jgi:hypothetical protein
MLGELWWVLPTAVMIGIAVAAVGGLLAWGFRDDEPDELDEWDRLSEEDRDILRGWFKHTK